MARSHFIILILVLVAASVWLAVWLRRKREQPAEPEQEGMVRRLPTAEFDGPPGQGLCEVAARALQAHIAIFSREDAALSLIASAPRRPQLEVLDMVAAEWALAHCVPTGRGTGMMAASEWQFQPIFRHGRMFGLLAIAGRCGREPVAPGQEWLLEDVLRHAGKLLDDMSSTPLQPVERPLLFG